MSGDTVPIPRKYRVGLASKGAMLGALCVVFTLLTVGMAFKDSLSLLLRLPLGAFFAVCTAFLAWTTWLAWADVIFGKAIKVTGARPLPSRKSGVSFRLAGGGSAEYLLVNSWAKTQLDHSYGLTIGRYSHVIIEEPRDEGVAK